MIKSLYFSQLSYEELEKIGTVDLTNDGNIFSPKLGTGNNVYCSICLDPMRCPGHIGYIKLCTPIFNPLFVIHIRNIINSICVKCYNIISNNTTNYETLAKLPYCTHCKTPSIKYGLNSSKTTLLSKSDETINLYPTDVKNIFKNINNDNLIRLGFIQDSHPKNFILDALPIAPNRIRLKDDFVNKCYLKIMNYNKKAFISIDNKFKWKHSLNIYKEYVSLLGINKSSAEVKSLRQRISGKTGTFRKFSLGKRNKYCGRSVITPDPNISIDTVGIPMKFVKNLIFKLSGLEKRTITDDDIILLNRQPSLQRMSLMAFKVKIFNTSTISLNPSVCPAFNADFDGDEMNVFFPTNIISKVEALELLDVRKCIISPQNNQPIIFPIQDSVTGLYLLSSSPMTLRNEVFNDCLTICSTNIKMHKHRNGKALISHILPDIDYSDDNLKIVRGNITDGVINFFSLKGMIKSIMYKFDEQCTSNFIADSQLLINRWLLDIGLSIGYHDCYVDGITDSEYLKNIYRYKRLDSNRSTIDIELNNITNMSQRLLTDNTKVQNNNVILKIVKSGSKGNMTNFTQIVSSVGQQSLQGMRPKLRLSKNSRTLAHFGPNSNYPEAFGFCFNSYTKGLSPTEYFFHCQGAREGLINTGVSTSKTGYIQRKFAKSLENITVAYDGTIRSGKNIIQLGTYSAYLQKNVE
jgi:DNA-directed RNA polymerase beta' subunit